MLLIVILLQRAHRSASQPAVRFHSLELGDLEKARGEQARADFRPLCTAVESVVLIQDDSDPRPTQEAHIFKQATGITNLVYYRYMHNVKIVTAVEPNCGELDVPVDRRIKSACDQEALREFDAYAVPFCMQQVESGDKVKLVRNQVLPAPRSYHMNKLFSDLT